MQSVVLLVTLLSFLPLATPQSPTQTDVKVGDQKVLVKPSQQGLKYFPDQPIALVSLKPIRFFMTVGNSTVAFEGRNWNSLRPVKKVLSKGTKGEFDNGYAGAGGVFVDGKNEFYEN